MAALTADYGAGIDRMERAGICYAVEHELQLTPADLERIQAVITERGYNSLQAAQLAYYLGITATHPEAVEDVPGF